MQTTLSQNAIDLRKVLPAPSRANKLANKHFPNHKKVTESYYNDFMEAFLIMGKNYIKENLSVINEAIWSFKFDKVFFCICLNPGQENEETYFGMCI
jgi:hypothetical protein